MSVTVELTYEMSRLVGSRRLEVEGAVTAAAAVAAAAAQCGDQAVEFRRLAQSAALVVNGVLVRHLDGPGSRVADGDRVGFFKMAAGG